MNQFLSTVESLTDSASSILTALNNKAQPVKTQTPTNLAQPTNWKLIGMIGGAVALVILAVVILRRR